MLKSQIAVIVRLLVISVAVLILPWVIDIIKKIVNKDKFDIYGKSTISIILKFSASLIISVWCLRYAVGYYLYISAGNGTETLTLFEEIFNSIVHSLKTFSMDEDYSEYIIQGKKMLGDMFGETTVLKPIYGIYASILNIAAPIAGGAIIFEILASFFPRIRLSFSYLAFWKEKYFFSELNNSSVALARSIYTAERSNFNKPILIFTDVYVDGDDEKKSELRLAAKLFNGICTREDLSHVKKNRLGKRKFFLIDENEAQNLQTLSILANSGNYKYLKKSEIYLFTNDDAYVRVENSVHDLLHNVHKFKSDELPIFVPIQSYRNMITNLLSDIPLYEPLVGKRRDRDGNQSLTVTILGTGFIGKEMFLTTYWMGQILNCKLKINVLSKESEEEFWSKIDYINPEIKRTTQKDDPILRYNSNGDYSDEYCNVEYIPCDIKSSKFIECLNNHNNGILDTDYFLVSIGSDEDNISVADTIRRYVGQHHIESQSADKTVIAYVVYDPDLSSILNRKNRYCYVNNSADIYMRAVGNLNDVNSVRNIFMTDHIELAEESSNAYNSAQSRYTRAKDHRERMEDDYKHWANLARSLHLKYKVYSAGMIPISIFDYDDGSNKRYLSDRCEYINSYINVMMGEVDLANEDDETNHRNLLHSLAWLEHRRWCAFTRVKGFRGTKSYTVYGIPGDYQSYKQMDVKLHPCLVECDKKGIRADISATGEIDESTIFKTYRYNAPDLLDELSMNLLKEDLHKGDFKFNDYPRNSFKKS